MLKLKLSRKNILNKGYTLVETMIVLGITGVLFVSVIAFVQGQQAKTEFNTGTREFESLVADVLNDLNTGYYPDFSGIRCIVNASKVPELVLAGGAVQGGSNQCIFLGKAIHFAPSSTNRTGINVYTVVGCRLVDSPTDPNAACTSNSENEVKSIQNAKPTVANNPNVKDFTERYTNRWNTKITKAYVSDNGGANASSTYGAGLALFYSSLGSNITTTGSAFGRQNISWTAIPNGTASPTFNVDTTEQNAVSLIRELENNDFSNGVSKNELHLCLLGGNGRKAELVIYGENDSTPQTRLNFNPAVETIASGGGCPS